MAMLAIAVVRTDTGEELAVTVPLDELAVRFFERMKVRAECQQALERKILRTTGKMAGVELE